MDTSFRTLAIFCKVVDNFGDIGICWRLARQFQSEHALDVTLWVDDLASFQRLCPAVARVDEQVVANVRVRHWPNNDGVFDPHAVADIVIEFFGVELPPAYVEAMARRDLKAVWINYEGLSAEEWVEGCHALPSMHPRLPLTKYFFFPGFTERTGGLLREADLEPRRSAFQAAPAQRAAFLARLGLSAQEQGRLLVSMFCYPHAPLAPLFAAWAASAQPLVCLVPEGVAADAVRAFLGAEPRPGACRTEGALTLRVIPFVPQPDYDLLCWSCDLNFVRGEDSWVRGQWAERPLVWHIYPQDENLHHKKLRAFLHRYTGPTVPALYQFTLAWNEAAAAPADWPRLWSGLAGEFPALRDHAAAWRLRLAALGDAATNLLTLASNRR